MKKIIKVGFPILCVAVIGGTFILLNKTLDRVNRNKLVEKESETNQISNQNIQSENYITNETLYENNVTNKVLSPKEEEELKNKEEENKLKAIEIVEKLAPPSSNNYYTNEGKDNDKYIVAIRDMDSKIAQIYYIVDIDKESIEIYTK